MVDPQYAGPPPTGRLTSAIVGVVALAGLLFTLLPMWTLTVNVADFGYYRSNAGRAGSNVELKVGFYDWIASSAPVVGLIPLALAVAAATALVQVVRGSDRTLWGATAALALSALVLAASVAIRPDSARRASGPLARELTPRGVSLDQPASMDVAFGAGLVISIIALVAVCALATWQYIAEGRPAVAHPPAALGYGPPR